MKASDSATIELASLKERKKEEGEKSIFDMSGSVCRRPLWKVPLYVLVAFHS